MVKFKNKIYDTSKNVKCDENNVPNWSNKVRIGNLINYWINDPKACHGFDDMISHTFQTRSWYDFRVYVMCQGTVIKIYTCISCRSGGLFFIIMNMVFGNLSAVELFIKERAIFL